MPNSDLPSPWFALALVLVLLSLPVGMALLAINPW